MKEARDELAQGKGNYKTKPENERERKKNVKEERKNKKQKQLNFEFDNKNENRRIARSTQQCGKREIGKRKRAGSPLFAKVYKGKNFGMAEGIPKTQKKKKERKKEGGEEQRRVTWDSVRYLDTSGKDIRGKDGGFESLCLLTPNQDSDLFFRSTVREPRVYVQF